MELSKFLSLCGVVFGFIAVLFLSKVLSAGADKMLHGTYHYSPMGWPSVQIISDRAGQKADTLSSVFLVFLALSLQACAIVVNNNVNFTTSWKRAILIGVALVAVVTVIIHEVDIGMKRYYEKEIKRLAAKDRVKSSIERMSVPLYSDVQAIAEQYFGFRKEAKEENTDFVKRFAAFLGYDVPANADFSKFR